MAFQTPVDIAALSCQHCGQFPITSFADTTRQATECNRAYDNERLSALQSYSWACAIKRVRLRAVSSTSQLWTPPTYASGNSYTVGQVVNAASTTYANGVIVPWILTAPTDTSSSVNPDVNPKWTHYFGNLMVDIWDNGVNYAAGEVALLPPVYNAGTTYAKGNMVIDSSGNMWTSLANSNTGHTPATSPTFWLAWVFPSSGLQNLSPPPSVSFNGTPIVYISTINNNGPAYFSPVPTPSSSAYWTEVDGTVAQLTVLWPLNSGPVNDASTMNVYKLPAAYLRPADTSAANLRSAHPWLGALYGNRATDRVFQNGYFSSWETGPIDFDFVADLSDVVQMDPLLCQYIAAMLADVIDVPLTQNKNAQKIATILRTVLNHARDQDAIIQSQHTQEQEEFVRVRF